MGSSKSKPNKPRHKKCYLNTKDISHCCLDQCFHPIEEITRLRHVADVQSYRHWHFTQTHEQHLRQCLSDYKLEDIAVVIIQYLQNDNNSADKYAPSENYRAFIRTAFSLLNEAPQNRQVCDVWYNRTAQQHGRFASREPAIKCVMLGAGAVGKSSLTTRFTENQYMDEYDPTIEDSFWVQFPLNVRREDMDKFIRKNGPSHNTQVLYDLYHSDQQQITVNIMDTCGREEFIAMVDLWFREGNLFFLVFDVTSQASFDEIRRIYDRIVRVKAPEWTEKHNGTDFGVICVGNKCDLRDVASYVYTSRWGRLVDMENAMKWFEEKQLPYIETSAKTGKNVNFLFRHAVFEYWVQSHTGCMPDCD